ncbi:MAG: class I SAM-dependent methyltransferase [Planctomycetaceae bacterium]
MNEIDELRVLHELRISPQIFERIAAGSGSEFRLQQELRAEFPEPLVRAAMQLAELRRKGAVKFSRASEMWFDRQGLEQSTPEGVARHKAKRFQGDVWDYCSGIGGDLIAVAEQGDRVVGVDQSAAACLRAQWNAEVYGVGERVKLVCADVTTLVDRTGLVHIDPDRRPAGSRSDRPTRRVEDAAPGLPFLHQLMTEFRGGAIKLSPAANFVGKFPGAEIELVSLNGECKEATVWFGELGTPDLWRATVLPEGETLAGSPLDAFAEVGPLGRYLYDPDPAVVRSGLVSLLAEQRGFTRLDDAEEYLTSSALIDTPFAHPFEVLAELPNNDREIRRYFRETAFGQLEIKCRHIPIQAEAVRRKLDLSGKVAGVLVFARVEGKARAVVCRRIER